MLNALEPVWRRDVLQRSEVTARPNGKYKEELRLPILLGRRREERIG
jgi:hypothetical protein